MRAAAPGHRRSGRSRGQMAGRVGPGSSGHSSTPVHVEQVALPHSQPLYGALWPHASGAEGVREVVRGLGGGHACQARRRLACTLGASNRYHHVPPRVRGHQPPIRAGCAGFKAGARAQGLVINGDSPLITVCCSQRPTLGSCALTTRLFLGCAGACCSGTLSSGCTSPSAVGPCAWSRGCG